MDTLRENERKVMEGCRNRMLFLCPFNLLLSYVFCSVREDIEARKDRLKERREMLTLALETHEEDRELSTQLEEEVSIERQDVLSLLAILILIILSQR